MHKNTDIPLISEQYYHIYNCGNNGENLFFEERNYQHFLKLYIKHIYPVTNTYAYCLMKNHFHILVRMKPLEELESFKNIPDLYFRQFSHLFNAYTKAINKAYDRKGSLFQKNFKRKLIDSDDYFVHLISYIHRNPQKHGFTDDYKNYPYSFYQTIYQQKNSCIDNKQIMGWFGDLNSFVKYHEKFDEVKIQYLTSF